MQKQQKEDYGVIPLKKLKENEFLFQGKILFITVRKYKMFLLILKLKVVTGKDQLDGA